MDNDGALFNIQIEWAKYVGYDFFSQSQSNFVLLSPAHRIIDWLLLYWQTIIQFDVIKRQSLLYYNIIGYHHKKFSLTAYFFIVFNNYIISIMTDGYVLVCQ